MRTTPNSRKSITPQILTNPLGVDGIVKALQAQMLIDLPWLEKSFNRATVMSRKNKEGDDEEFPVCEIATEKDKLNMIGLDDWSAYSFFFSKDPETPIDFEQFTDSKYERELSLYVWIHLDRAQAINSFEYPDVLKQEIKTSIRNTVLPNDDYFTIGDVVDNPLDVFDGFTLDEAKTQSLYAPYKAYRFDLNCFYTDAIFCLAELPAPTNLVLSNVTSSSIQLDWDLNSEGNETGVLIQRNEDGAGFVDLITLGAGVETHTDTTVSGSTDYDYRVQSKNGSLFLDSAFSNIASETTLPSGFVSTWNTSNAGTSNNDQIALPLSASGTYPFDVIYLGNVIKTVASVGDNVITFPDGAGIKTIEIKETIGRWQFNNGGDKLKITNISNWGALILGTTQAAYFYGCRNMTITAGTDLDMSLTTNFVNAFRDTGIINFPLIDTSGVTTMSGCFRDSTELITMSLLDTSSCSHMSSFARFCSSLTTLPLWDLSNVAIFSNAFGDTGITSAPIFNLASMTNGSNMFINTNMGTVSWDALLEATEINNQNNSVTWHGGSALRTKAPSDADDAKDHLEITHSWTIIDGGETP